MFANRRPIIAALLLVLMFTAACGGQGGEEPALAGAPLMGQVVPFGTPIVRDLAPTLEVVPNCDGVTSPVIKHPSMTVGSSHSVEWQVGGSVGTGITIGKGILPGGVDLQAALEGHVANDLTNSIQQSNAWELPADPGTIMEYTIMWREVWQPAYLDVTFMEPEPAIARIELKYRTGVQSDIVGDNVTRCDSGANIEPQLPLADAGTGAGSLSGQGGAAQPTTTAPLQMNTPQPPPTATPVPPTPAESVTSTSFEVYANLSWQDTGVSISPGDRVRVIWDGKSRWRGVNSGDFSDPLGGYSDPNANYGCPPLMPSAEAGWNAMVAKVGQGGVVTNPFKVSPVGDGTLYLAMNDCDEQRYDNEGSAVVTIEVRR